MAQKLKHEGIKLSPVELTLEKRLEVLQRAGLVAWNGQNLKPIQPVVVNCGEKQVSDLLVEMREQGDC